MMFAQALGLLMLFAAYAVQAKYPAGETQTPTYRYEEDPEHSEEQKVEELAEVGDTWFVKKRNLPPTGFTCHSATKVLEGEGDYTYLFNVRNGSSGEHYIKWNVTMTPVTTRDHTKPNAVRYYYLPRKMYPTQTQQTSKLMTYDSKEGCAVFVTVVVIPQIGLHRACMAVQTRSSVQRNISARCNNVYSTYCPYNPALGEDTPWDDTCKVPQQ
uniref:Lipocalin n=1 Tax=Rhipicephalus appendiculatus TaxID=34631 RepID=A0A131YHB9_RHIAP